MNTGKLLLGVLAGVAAGTVLGILFAPGKGSDTRKKITEKGEDFVDSLKEKFNELTGCNSKNVEDKEEAVHDEHAHAAL